VAENGIAIGLDIDEKSIKFVKIKQTDSVTTLLKYAIRDIPSSQDKVKTISDILKELFKGEKPDIEVYASAFGPNISLKRIIIPVMPDEEIPEALKWEAKNLIPFPIENAVIDFYKIEKFTDKSTEKYDIMFAVAAEELITTLNAISVQSGIKFNGISILPLALCGILEKNIKIEKDKISAIIDIGFEAASINLFRGDVLQFTREITVAGDSLTKAMTGLLVADHWQLNLTYEQAEEIKKKYGIPKKDTAEVTDGGIPLIHVFEMMAPTLRRLQNEILRSFDYYKEEFREEKIDNIYLTGGSSTLTNLGEFLSNALGIKVETLNPIQNMKIDPASGINKEKLNEESPRLAAAVGLVLEKGGKINFAKKKGKPKSKKINIEELLRLNEIFKNFQIKIPANLTVWAVLLVLVLGITYNMYLGGVRDKYKKELASKQLLLIDVKSLIEKRGVMDQISKQETHLHETLSQITYVLPVGISLSDLTYDNARQQIWITGVAASTKTVGRLLKSFEDSLNFRQIVLIEARKTVVDGVQKVLFKVTFVIS
jgi:type IV pilus assembly protein PilM